MTKLELTAVGGSLGVVIPDEMLTRLKVREGDWLYALEEPDGTYRLVRREPAHAGVLEKAEDIMRRYEKTLDILAR